MTSCSAPSKHPVPSKLDDPPQCWQITDHGWTSLQKENHFLFSHVQGHSIQGYISSALNTRAWWNKHIQKLSARNQKYVKFPNLEIDWASTQIGTCFVFLPGTRWSALLTVVEIFARQKKKSQETNCSRQASRFLRMQQSSFFALICHLKSFRDSICLRVKQASVNTYAFELSPCCWSPSVWPKATLLLKYLLQKSHNMEKFLNSH